MDLKPVSLAPGLYIVATPIGNLKDITLRAIETLISVDRILCEDTRVTGKLLKHYGITATLGVYNDHSQAKDRKKIREQIETGNTIALVSDAGTPLISDPGYKLVRDLQQAELHVTTLPGPSAAIAALTLSALPTDQFVFAGFLPSKSSARKTQLASYQQTEQTLVFYERGSRLGSALDDIYTTLGECDVVIARELSKRYEETTRLTLGGDNHPQEVKGEVVLLVRTRKHDTSDDDIIARLTHHLASLRTRDAVDAVVAETGAPKKQVYQLALTLKS